MIERLTTAQAEEVRRAYRDAYAANNHSTEIARFYLKYEKLYGVSRQTLRAEADVDRARHAPHYEALKKHRQEKEQKRKQNREKKNKKQKHQRERLRLQNKSLRLPEGVSVADYYGRATYCPVCHVTLGRTSCRRMGLPRTDAKARVGSASRSTPLRNRIAQRVCHGPRVTQASVQSAAACQG
jgi:hypothetical protein